jgi:hypothetical protein
MGGSADRAAVATLWSRLIRYVAGDPEFAEYHVAWQQPVVAPGGRIEGVLRPATDVAEVALVDRAGHVVTGATLADGRVRAEAPTTDATLYLALDGTRAPEPVIVELPLAERTGTDVDRRAWLRWSDRVGARVETLEDFDARAAAKRLAERARTVIRRDVTSVTDLRLYWLIGLALLLADFSVRRLAGEP